MISGKWLQSSESPISCSIIVTAEPLQAETGIQSAIQEKLDPLPCTFQTSKGLLEQQAVYRQYKHLEKPKSPAALFSPASSVAIYCIHIYIFWHLFDRDSEGETKETG